jgi:uncharacterized membrane protein YcaP (DUF421 family)
VCMRLLGKRMSSQLTRNETAALVALAAAIGVPILAPDRGLLPAVIIALVVVCISRMVSKISAINPKIENATQGRLETLIKDSVIMPDAVVHTRITRERIMAQLRAEQITHLGEVDRLYFEPTGEFTAVRAKTPRPGLAIIPEDDRTFLLELRSNGVLVCHECGFQNPGKGNEYVCPNCKNKHWVKAII